MNKWLRTALVVGFVTGAVLTMWARADENPPASNGGNKSDAEGRVVAYLGVAVEPLHPAFWVHMHRTLDHKQGLLVTDVAHDSPAAKAGLKPNDILMSYGDQKLFAPDQLAGLIEADKVGSPVILDVMRKGAKQEIKVVLGEHRVYEVVPVSPRWRLPGWGNRVPTTVPIPGSHAQNSGPKWMSFDSLTMKNLGSGRFNVEVAFETKDGALQRRRFEGTRDEIRAKIEGDRELPDAERRDLLQSLDLQDDPFAMELPSLHFSPDGQLLLDIERSNRKF